MTAGSGEIRKGVEIGKDGEGSPSVRSAEQVFEVFCRIAPGDPMSHIGTLNAPHIDLARVYAWKIYDEEDWADMWVVPRAAIANAHPSGQPGR